jgi:hypothetical protein
LYRDPIADFDFAFDQRPTQRRFRARRELSIARDIQMERTQVLLKTCDVLYGSEPKNGLRAHAGFQSLNDNFIAMRLLLGSLLHVNGQNAAGCLV